MEIWLDSSDLSFVEKASKMGIVQGVTTNPSILAKSSKGLEELLAGLLKNQNGPLAVQVTSPRAEEMVKQGLALRSFSDRTIIKVPTTSEGLTAMHELSKAGVPVMATAIFDIPQVLLAARAGAGYIAPYFSHICEHDMNGLDVLKGMCRLLHRYNYTSKLLGASLQTLEQVKECFELGIAAMTLNEKVFEEFVSDHPLTIKSIDRFDRDWKTSKHKSNLLFQS